MADLKATAEKKFKSRIRKFKKVNKDETEKEKFFNELGASLEIFLPSKNPEESSDSILIFTTIDGKVVHGEYSYIEEGEFEQLPIESKDLKVILESIESDFNLEFNEEE